MIVQDSQIMPASLTDIFKNAEQRKRILKIIIQTLYNMGYEQSAVELEMESKITYLTPEIKAIKSALPEERYEQVQLILKQSPKYGEVRDVLNQLKCLKMIREGKMQQALCVIQNQIKDASKQNQLSEELMMGTGQIKQEVLRKKHHYIVETCFQCEISPNSMLKMINCYVELEKRGLTASISPQFSLLKNPSTLRGPPMRLLQVANSVHLKSINFIRFNRSSTKLLVVSSQKRQKWISIWKLSREKNMLSEYKSCTFSIDEQVVNASWNYDQSSQLVAIATCSHVCVLNHDFTVKDKKKINTGLTYSNRILCLNWNPLTNFLYVGGAFDNIKVFGSTLDQILTIQPFIRTRNLYFNIQGTHMYAVSATKGLFSYYNLFEYKQQANFTTEESITSFRLQNKDKNIVLVTQKKIIYLSVQIDKPNKFSVLYKFNNNFSENGLVEIEACLFHPWVVCLGDKQFQAFSIEKDSHKQEKWGSKDSFTFDITDGFMVSGSKELYLWGSRNFQDDLESERQSLGMEEDNKKKVEQNQPGQNNENESNNSSYFNEQEEEEDNQEQESLMDLQNSSEQV